MASRARSSRRPRLKPRTRFMRSAQWPPGTTEMLLASTGLIFVALVAFSVPIVFALGAAAVTGLVLGGFSLEMLASSLVGASQNWVLLAIPSFIFAGTVMERCGMSSALVDLARALVGWLRGGLGMSVIVVSYFFSDICGSKMAEVSALGSTLMQPLKRAGYRAEDGASLIAAGTAVGMLGGFYMGVFTATEAGAVVAFYSVVAALFYYKNVGWRDLVTIAYDSAI